MKHAIVKLTVRSGEYENESIHLITRDVQMTKREMGIIAMESEARCDLEWEDEDKDSAYDCNGELYIYVYSVEKLTKAEFKVLNKFL